MSRADLAKIADREHADGMHECRETDACMCWRCTRRAGNCLTCAVLLTAQTLKDL